MEKFFNIELRDLVRNNEVKSVTAAVAADNGQNPKFGKIQGFDGMNGTFFFVG